MPPSLEDLARARNAARQRFGDAMKKTAEENDGCVTCSPSMPGYAEFDAAEKALAGALDAVGF